MSPSLEKPSIDCNRKAGRILPSGSALLHSTVTSQSIIILSTPHFHFVEDDEHPICIYSFASFEGCGLTLKDQPWSQGGWDVEADRPGFKFYTWPLPMWDWIGHSTLQSYYVLICKIGMILLPRVVWGIFFLTLKMFLLEYNCFTILC